MTVRIDDGVVDGRFPRRGLRLTLEWYTLHQGELSDNWARAQEHKQLRRIAPLE